MKLTLLINVLLLCSTNLLAQRIPPLNPDSLGIGPTKISRCYPLRDDSKIGFNYGVNSRSFGIKVHDFRSWHLSIPLMLSTDMEWRVPRKGDGYFNLEFTRDRVAAIGKFSLASNLGYKRILSNSIKVNNQVYAGLSISTWDYGVALAYARQDERQSETSLARDNGIMLQLYHEFFEQVEVTVKSIFWFDQFQYSLKIKEDLFQSGFLVGLGYEKAGDWEEFDISIMYRYK
jgi:hypothetical protein